MKCLLFKYSTGSKYNKLVVFLLFLLLIGLEGRTQDVKFELNPNKSEFAPLPVINYSNLMGLGLGVSPVVLYRISEKDTISPESISGVLTAVTTNGSYLISGFTRLFVNEDNWRFTTIFGTGDINFQYFLADINLPVSGFFDYETDFKFFAIRVERQLWPKFYLGTSYGRLKSETVFPEQGIDEEFENEALQLNLTIDKRSDVYYPRGGYLMRLNNTFRPDWLANDESNYNIALIFNKYWSTRQDKDVIAGRIRAEVGLGEIAFNNEVIIGRRDLRGYTEGRYRGESIYALQGEYRWNFHRKWGAVGFLGVATLDGSVNEDFNWDIYPSVGTGIRYRIFKIRKITLGFDLAQGKDDLRLYFRIGEAF